MAQNRKPRIEVGIDGTQRRVSKSPGTITAYRARFPQLARRAGVEPHNHAAVVDWFVAQDNNWSVSTISQYRGAIIQAFEDDLGN
jgi:hypothetical protein